MTRRSPDDREQAPGALADQFGQVIGAEGRQVPLESQRVREVQLVSTCRGGIIVDRYAGRVARSLPPPREPAGAREELDHIGPSGEVDACHQLSWNTSEDYNEHLHLPCSLRLPSPCVQVAAADLRTESASTSRLRYLVLMIPTRGRSSLDATNPEQAELPLAASGALLPGTAQIEVVDLFAGIGGLSSGFSILGFSVTGIDAEPTGALVYESARYGTAHTMDLKTGSFAGKANVVVGGPPCRPWSPVNLQRRGDTHEDHRLLTRFVEHVQDLRPEVFIMENVPALRGDQIYKDGVRVLRDDGYDVDAHILHYDRFGAATRRRRLFTAGVRGANDGAQRLFQHLRQHYRPARTVRDAIWRFRDLPAGAVPDHDWSNLKSIGNYRQRYESGQYGWRRLDYDVPAPSFGSVAKTYILHPEAGIDGYPERVLSVREVLAITGFPDSVSFPGGTPRAKRYQMVANAVSPQVSLAVAIAVQKLLRFE